MTLGHGSPLFHRYLKQNMPHCENSSKLQTQIVYNFKWLYLKIKLANPLCYYTNLANALKDTICRLRAGQRQTCPWIVQYNVSLVYIFV